MTFLFLSGPSPTLLKRRDNGCFWFRVSTYLYSGFVPSFPWHYVCNTKKWILLRRLVFNISSTSGSLDLLLDCMTYRWFFCVNTKSVCGHIQFGVNIASFVSKFEFPFLRDTIGEMNYSRKSRIVNWRLEGVIKEWGCGKERFDRNIFFRVYWLQSTF